MKIIRNLACCLATSSLLACAEPPGMGDGEASDSAATVTTQNLGLINDDAVDALPVEAQSGCETSVASECDEVAKLLTDRGFGGRVPIVAEEGWVVHYDKRLQRVVAIGEGTTLSFDPRTATEAELEYLVHAGLPESIAASWRGSLCRAACWGAAAAGCAAVSVTCGIGTVVSVGGFAIPCSVIIVSACGAGAAAGSGCSDWCGRFD